MSDKLRPNSDQVAQANRRAEMPPVYFETQFEQESAGDDWPDEFAILTAWATTGTTRTAEENLRANQNLETELRRRSAWVRRLTGFSPTTGHAEPGWAVALDFDAACDIGRSYLQDAIYYVSADTLSVSFCDTRRMLVEIGEFRCRVR